MSSIFLCGPMTGYPAYNVDMFMEVKKLWERYGWTVKTPFDSNSIVWQKYFKRNFDPELDRCEVGDPFMPEIQQENRLFMNTIARIAMLPGWHRSAGARREHEYALKEGFIIYSVFNPVYTNADSTE